MHLIVPSGWRGRYQQGGAYDPAMAAQYGHGYDPYAYDGSYSSAYPQEGQAYGDPLPSHCQASR
jgi:hypothetical protein